MFSISYKTISLRILFSLFIIFLYSNAFGQEPASLQKGINQYKEEDFEEAIETLTRARKEAPKSSVAAFFLGLTYKQTLEYEKALKNLRDAVTLTPRIKEAVIELVDVAMQLGELEEAKKWIGVAEREGISPAKTAFLKGLILTEEGKNKEAAEAFEKAKSIDPNISQAADIQIALSLLRERELKKAKDRLQKAILHDPQSDLAGFARQYLNMVNERLFVERPFRFSLGFFGGYDDNMVLKPTDETLAVGITNESSRLLNSSFRVTYAPTLKGSWLFNAQYGVSSSVHQKNVHTHDSFSNTISITPGYNYGKYSMNLAMSYTISHVRSPSYDKYSGSFSTGPLLRFVLKPTQLLELYAGYKNDEYFEPALTDVDDRDSKGFNSYLSWIWLFRKDSFFNVRYQFSDSNADGANWDNRTHGLSANVTIPIVEKLKLQLSGQVNRQRYRASNVYFNIRRKDEVYNMSGGFSWSLSKNITAIAQYTRTRDDSNIGIYDYKKNLYALGFELVF